MGWKDGNCQWTEIWAFIKEVAGGNMVKTKSRLDTWKHCKKETGVTQPGQKIKKGQTLMSGALLALIPDTRSNIISISFDNLRVISIQCCINIPPTSCIDDGTTEQSQRLSGALRSELWWPTHGWNDISLFLDYSFAIWGILESSDSPAAITSQCHAW